MVILTLGVGDVYYKDLTPPFDARWCYESNSTVKKTIKSLVTNRILQYLDIYCSNIAIMALEETVEERAARKALKKQSREKGTKTAKVVESDEAEVKTSKKRKAVDENSTESVVKSAKTLKADGSEDVTRRRTRSLSNAEEVYPIGQSPEDFRKEHQLSITGNSDNGGAFVAPAPMTAFTMTPFSQPIRKALDAGILYFHYD
jgi:hypothetical protein